MTGGRFQKLPPERRAVILGAITAEVAEHGFAGASVTRIAERAETSKASLFYYFADRDEMLAAAVGAFFEQVLGLPPDGGAPLPVPAPAKDFWAGIEELYRSAVERMRADPARARFAHAWLEVMGRSDPPPALRPFVDRARAMVDALVSAGVERGAIRPGFPTPLLSRTLFAFVVAADGWMAETVLHRNMPMESAVGLVLGLVRAAFEAPRPAKERAPKKGR